MWKFADLFKYARSDSTSSSQFGRRIVILLRDRDQMRYSLAEWMKRSANFDGSGLRLL